MTQSGKSRLRDLCARLHEDDTDPRLDHKHTQHRAFRPHRKDQQLCKQVRHALEHAIATLSIGHHDQVLSVVSVEPDPGTSRMVITLAPQGSSPRARDAAMRALPALAPTLRAELARTLSRKRLPPLHCVLLPAPPIDSDQEDSHA